MLVRARPFLELEELLKVLASDAGEEDIVAFENNFSQKIGAPNCFATHQGRDALSIALKIIGIRAGDEIIVPNFICEVVIDTILDFGAVPVLVDNSIVEFNATIEDYEKEITLKTKAILALHLYGIPAKMNQLEQLAEQHNIYLLEDCAQTVASTIDGKNVGTFGHMSFFSFNYDKPMSLGQGGMLVINDPKLFKLARTNINNFDKTNAVCEKDILKSLMLQHYLTAEGRYQEFLPITFSLDAINYIPGISKRIDRFIESGNTKYLVSISQKIKPLQLLTKIAKRVRKFNSHSFRKSPMLMNGLLAKLGTLQLAHVDLVEEKRGRNSQAYRRIFGGNENYRMPPESQSFFTAFSRFTVLTRESADREQLIAEANKLGVELDHSNWKKTILSHAVYQNKVKGSRELLQQSEEFAASIIHFPTHYYVTENHLKKIETLVSKGNV
jgi:perosamine synthetase